MRRGNQKTLPSPASLTILTGLPRHPVLSPWKLTSGLTKKKTVWKQLGARSSRTKNQDLLSPTSSRFIFSSSRALRPSVAGNRPLQYRPPLPRGNYKSQNIAPCLRKKTSYISQHAMSLTFREESFSLVPPKPSKACWDLWSLRRPSLNPPRYCVRIRLFSAPLDL